MQLFEEQKIELENIIKENPIIKEESLNYEEEIATDNEEVNILEILMTGIYLIEDKCKERKIKWNVKKDDMDQDLLIEYDENFDKKIPDLITKGRKATEALGIDIYKSVRPIINGLLTILMQENEKNH